MINNEYKLVLSLPNHPDYQVTVTGMRHRKPTTFVIDADKVEQVRQHTWTVRARNYVSCSRCSVLLHRFVTSAAGKEVIDHIDHNPLNNCVRNLRVADHKVNRWNTIKHDSIVPVFGVHPTPSGRWRAHIHIGHVLIKLGEFEHVYDAVLCRVREEYIRRGDATPNYRGWLNKLPRRFLIKWLPELYGDDNDRYIGTELWTAHYGNNRTNYDRERWRKQARGVRKISDWSA